MTIANHFGKPDFFIRLTCNPKWNEIIENLQNYDTAIGRPDLVVKVSNFKIKFNHLLNSKK